MLSSTVIRLDHQKTSKKVGVLSNKWINNNTMTYNLHSLIFWPLSGRQLCSPSLSLSGFSHLIATDEGIQIICGTSDLPPAARAKCCSATGFWEGCACWVSAVLFFLFFECSWRLGVANLWDLFCKVFCSLVEAYWVSLLLLFWGQPLA